MALAKFIGFACPPTFVWLFVLLSAFNDDGLILNIVFIFDLQSVRVDLHLLDVINWWHVLLVILLVVLLSSKLTNLEHLKPAFVAKHLSAELDHFTIDRIVWRNVIDQSSVYGLNIRNHLHVNLDSVFQLAIVKGQVFHRRFEVEAKFVPDTPRLFLSFLDEVLKVIVGPITEHFKELKLFLSLCISLYLKPLRTINDIFCHTNFQSIFYDVIVEAPRVEIGLLGNFISNSCL